MRHIADDNNDDYEDGECWKDKKKVQTETQLTAARQNENISPPPPQLEKLWKIDEIRNESNTRLHFINNQFVL